MMEDIDWATSIDNAKDNFNQETESGVWTNLSIYKIPQYMKTNDLDGGAYKPQVVSIGPFHFGENHLMPMEEHKRRAFIHLLTETDKTVEDYMGPLRVILPELMDSYEQLDERWRQEQNEFLQLIVLDGCFVIEIIRKNFTNYAPSDPIFSEQRQPTVIEYIKRDLLLMENQLPLPVLEKLAAILATATGVQSNINSLLLNFCFPDKRVTYMGRGKHMLDVVRQSMVQSTIMDQDNQRPIVTSQFVQCMTDISQIGERSLNNNRCATVLYDAGIKFVTNKTQNLKNIAFKNGNLHLPTITIERNSESMFLNFIAFEQLHLEAGRSMSSYFLFMSGLITSVNDVRFLRDRGIIESSTVYDDTIREIIMKLTKGLFFGKDDNFCELQQELNNYYMISKDTCKRKMDRWYLKLYDTYFESPWSIIKLVAGFFILTATIIGAIYAAVSNYDCRN